MLRIMADEIKEIIRVGHVKKTIKIESDRRIIYFCCQKFGIKHEKINVHVR